VYALHCAHPANIVSALRLYLYRSIVLLQCFDTVSWVTGRSSLSLSV